MTNTEPTETCYCPIGNWHRHAKTPECAEAIAQLRVGAARRDAIRAKQTATRRANAAAKRAEAVQ